MRKEQLCAGLGERSEMNIVCSSLIMGPKANFISPELAEKLGICAEEMGPTCDANMANPELSTPITPIIGKLVMHI